MISLVYTSTLLYMLTGYDHCTHAGFMYMYMYIPLSPLSTPNAATTADASDHDHNQQKH